MEWADGRTAFPGNEKQYHFQNYFVPCWQGIALHDYTIQLLFYLKIWESWLIFILSQKLFVSFTFCHHSYPLLNTEMDSFMKYYFTTLWKTCLCWPQPLCKLHYSSVFIFWENKMLINSGQETYNGWHDRWQIEMCSCHPLPAPHWSDCCIPPSYWLMSDDTRTISHKTNNRLLCLQCNKYWEILHINEYWCEYYFMSGFIDKGYYKCTAGLS